MEDMAKREQYGQLELMVLLAVIQCGSESYGVPIAKQIERIIGRSISLSSVYAALERLERKGLVTATLGQPTAERGGKARAYFEATSTGVKEARSALAALKKLTVGVPALAGALA
jgi:DNA-binding PadR family transcriptional regulator